MERHRGNDEDRRVAQRKVIVIGGGKDGLPLILGGSQ